MQFTEIDGKIFLQSYRKKGFSLYFKKMKLKMKNLYRKFCLLLMFLSILKEIKCLDFCFNASFEDFRLNAKILRTESVPTKIQCILICAQDSCCRSLNFKHKSNCNEQSKCELLHDTLYNASDGARLEKNNSYDHVFLNEPKKELNSKCFPKESCADIYTSGEREDGIYTIDPDGQGSFPVRCLMTAHPGGWTMIQRRQDGSVGFFRTWADYRNGFGNLSGEFWLGLDKIHRLTKSGQNVLRIAMSDRQNVSTVVNYTKFFVSNENEQFKLDISGYSGSVRDAMEYHNGKKFHTKDKDNYHDCAESKKGGWWYVYCAATNPNGHYEASSNGLYWELKQTNKKNYIYPKTFQMVLRPSEEP